MKIRPGRLISDNDKKDVGVKTKDVGVKTKHDKCTKYKVKGKLKHFAQTHDQTSLCKNFIFCWNSLF